MNNNAISVKEYFGDNWREYLAQESIINDIIDKTGLKTSYDYVNIHSRLLIDDDRAAVRVLLRNRSTGIIDKIIIDFISNFPTLEQVIDVNFRIGSDCSFRIIAFDMNPGKDDFFKYEHSGPILITGIMKHHTVNVPVYFFSMESNIADGPKSVLINPYETIKPASTHPSSLQTYENVYFVLSLWNAYEDNVSQSPHKAGNSPFYGHDKNHFDHSEYSANWDKGTVRTEIKCEADDLKWLLKRRKANLEEMFEYCRPVQIDGKRDTITVVKYIPLSNFVYSPGEREEFKNTAHQGSCLSHSLSELIAERYE